MFIDYSRAHLQPNIRQKQNPRLQREYQIKHGNTVKKQLENLCGAVRKPSPYAASNKEDQNKPFMIRLPPEEQRNLAQRINTRILNGEDKALAIAKEINPTHLKKGGRKKNCINCAVALDHNLSGRVYAISRPAKEGKRINLLSDKYKANFSENMTRDELKKYIALESDGFRGIVFGKRSKRANHVFNVSDPPIR